MADACYGAADYSALGRGKHRHAFDNQLTEAPEEEEDFDVLNDETFGDFEDVGTFDWEEQHEKFAETLETNGDRTLDSGFNTAEKTYRSQEEYMEHSISQLMVDDEDIEDPAIVNVRKAKAIPRKQQSLDSLFGPASPPSFLDTEHLVSPTSKNIWGSPSVGHNSMPKPVSNIQSLFDFAKAASRDSPVPVQSPHAKAPVVLPRAQTLEEIENSLLHKPQVLTAEELERQLRGEITQRRGSAHAPEQQFDSPRPNGSSAPHPMNYPPPNMAPTPPRPMPPHLPQGMSPGMLPMMNGRISPLQGHMVAPGSTPPYRGGPKPMGMQTPGVPTRRSPLLGSPSPPPLGHSPSPPPLPKRPVSPLEQLRARITSPLAQAAAIARIIESARVAAGTPGRNYSQPIGIPPGMRGPPVRSPFNSPQTGGYGSPQGPYHSPQNQRIGTPGSMGTPGSIGTPGSMGTPGNMGDPHLRYMQERQQNQNRQMYMSPSQRGGYNNRNNNNRDYNRDNRDFNRDNRDFNRDNRYPRGPHYRRDEERDWNSRGSRNDDDYKGIMTQKEKDWIIKIQLLQLQTDNPYLDDYYYTTYCLLKKARETEKDGTLDPKLVIPAMAKVENKSYKPAQFEGSLGRLTTSSVHNPRQIIDLLAKSVSESAGTGSKKTGVGKELRKSRQLLMDIEKGYNLLLEIGDIEMKILALPDDARGPLFEERGYRIDLLFHYLLCDGNSAAFMQYMNVRKGRHLTTRSLPLLDKVQSVGIVSLIFKNLQQLMKKNDPEYELENMYEPCARVIDSCNLATIVMFMEDIQNEESQSQSKPIAIAIQNKLGSSLVGCLLNRGEQIYSTTSPVDLESNLVDEWSQFVHDFASILAVVPLDSVVPPIRTYTTITDHLERLLNKRLLAVVEDRLHIFVSAKEDKS